MCDLCGNPRHLMETTSDYWKSPAGITRRIDSLSDAFSVKIINNAYKIYGKTAGVEWVKWITHPEKTKTGPCPICDGRSGHRWKTTWFTPALPAHPRCVCQWEYIIVPEEIAEVPVVVDIRLPNAVGLEIYTPKWDAILRVVKTTAIVLAFAVTDPSERTKMYNTLEKTLRNRGYTFILIDVPVDEEEMRWWIARGYRLDGSRLVKRIN